jgi:hypothetical protein
VGRGKKVERYGRHAEPFLCVYPYSPPNEIAGIGGDWEDETSWFSGLSGHIHSHTGPVYTNNRHGGR